MKARSTNALSASAPTRDVARLSALAARAYAEKNMDAVLDLSSRVLEADPQNIVAQKFVARVRTQQGETDLAEPIWRRLCATLRDKTEPALNLARIAYARGDWDEMARFADLAVRESGERADAMRLAITARIRAKRPDELPDMLVRFHDAEPDSAFALLKTLSGPELAQAQASVLVRLRASAPEEPALESLTHACRKSWEVGALRTRSTKDSEVRAAYLRAIWTIDPGSRETIDGLNALSRERLRFLRMAIKKGDDEVALQHAEAVAEFNPASFEAWFAIARLSAASDPERSAACFRACAELRPGDVYYRFRQGLALTRSDRPADAIRAFRAVVEGAGDPGDPLAIAANARIANLRPRAFERAIEAARGAHIEDARSDYIVATGSTGADGDGLPLAAHGIFWAHMIAAQIKVGMRSVGRGAAKTWKRTKGRFARMKQRLLIRRATSVARHAPW